MAGVNDLGFLKAAAGGGCVKKGFKRGMMDPPMEKARSQRPPHSSPVPAMVADSLPPASLPRVVWPWAGGAGGEGDLARSVKMARSLKMALSQLGRLGLLTA